MRKTLLLSAAALGLIAGPAFAQTQDIRPGHIPGVGESYPASSQASNIDSSDARSTIAPTLPEPPGGPTAGPDRYIREAKQALMRHQTGMAQQAIEMAETRLLDRSVVATEVNAPDQNPTIATLEQARQAIARHDWRGAEQHLSAALTQTAAAGGTPMTQTPEMSGSGTGMSHAGMSGSSPAGMSSGAGGGMTGATAPSSPGSTAPGESDGIQPSATPAQQ